MTHVNFLETNRDQWMAHGYWIAACLVVIMVGALSIGGLSYDNAKKKSEHERLLAEVAVAETQGALPVSGTDHAAKASEIQGKMAKRIPWSELIAQVSGEIPEAITLQSINGVSVPAPVLQIKGIQHSSGAVADLIIALKKTGLFQDVRLSVGVAYVKSTSGNTSFQVDCMIRGKSNG